MIKISSILFMCLGLSFCSAATKKADNSTEAFVKTIQEPRSYTFAATDGSAWKIRITLQTDDPDDPWSAITCKRIEWYHPNKKVWYDAVIVDEFMTGPTGMRAVVKSKESGKYYTYDFCDAPDCGVVEYNGRLLTYEEEPDFKVRQKQEETSRVREYVEEKP